MFRIINDAGDGGVYQQLGGHWIVGYGDEFPILYTGSGQRGTAPPNALFYRSDLGVLYRWDAPTRAWVSEDGFSGLTTRGDILGRNTGANARIPGPPTGYNANGWPYVLQASDPDHMAAWGLPWDPQAVTDLVNNTVTDVMYLPLQAGATADGSSAAIRYFVYVDDNTDAQQETGVVYASCVRTSAGVITNQVAKEAKTALASSGTLTVTFSLSNDAGNNRVIVQVNANSSLTPTDQSIVMGLDDHSWTGLSFPFGL